jgi:hypothetical protein
LWGFENLSLTMSTNVVKIYKSLALIAAASFFVFFRFLILFGMTECLKNKKDIAESRFPPPKK